MLLCVAVLACVACVSAQSAGQEFSGCNLDAFNGNGDYFVIRGTTHKYRCPDNTKFDITKCACARSKNAINYTPEQLKIRRMKQNNMDYTGRMNGGNGKMENGLNGGSAYGVNNPQVTSLPVPTQPTTPPPCPFRANADPHLYEQFILGFDWTVRSCARGTLYSESACACHLIDPNQDLSCRAELWINFNGKKIEDSAGYHISVGNNGNVINVTNAGQFDGTGTLTVWLYANQNFGTEFTINLRFYEFPGGQFDEQVLVSNCYSKHLGSIEIAIDTVTKEVVFRVETRGRQQPSGIELRVPYLELTWKNVTLEYDGRELVAQVNDEIRIEAMRGEITNRPNGLLIGSCNGRGYVGYMDDFRVYKCLREGRGKGRARQNPQIGGQAGQDMMPSAGTDPAYNLGPVPGVPTGPNEKPITH